MLSRTKIRKCYTNHSNWAWKFPKVTALIFSVQLFLAFAWLQEKITLIFDEILFFFNFFILKMIDQNQT
jgi:hypothetical protein